MKILALSGSLRASPTTRRSRAQPASSHRRASTSSSTTGSGCYRTTTQDLDRDARRPEPVPTCAPDRRRRRAPRRDARVQRLAPQRPEERDRLGLARHRGSWLRDKTVAIAGATTGQYGAIWAQQDLRRILGIAGARVIEGEVPVARAQNVFDGAERLRDTLVQSATSTTSSRSCTRPQRLSLDRSPRERFRSAGEERRGAAVSRPFETDTSVGLVEALPARALRHAQRESRAPYAG